MTKHLGALEEVVEVGKDMTTSRQRFSIDTSCAIATKPQRDSWADALAQAVDLFEDGGFVSTTEEAQDDDCRATFMCGTSHLLRRQLGVQVARAQPMAGGDQRGERGARDVAPAGQRADPDVGTLRRLFVH
jgi:hypothetical protein